MNKELIEFTQKDCVIACEWSNEKLAKLRNQKILVTGGTGFMGTWLAEFISFLNDNYNFNISLLILARNIDIFKEQRSHLAKRKDIQFLSADLRNLNNIPNDISFIIHAATSPDNRFHVSNPIETISIITKGTSNLLDLAFNLPSLKKMLFLSSGQVCGKMTADKESIAEHDFGSIDCNQITSVYPEAKRLAESICCAYSSQYKLPIVIGRPFSFIGPYQSLNKPWAINNFINDALNSRTIRIIGNGKPVRSFMYPADMVVWLLKILSDGIPSKAYNIGSPYGISLQNLAQKIKESTQSNVEIINKFQNDDISKYIPDVNLCVNELGLKLHYDADKTIERAVNWFKLQAHNE